MPPAPDLELLATSDELGHPNFIGNFSKGLPHTDLGEVHADAYAALLTALSTRDANGCVVDPHAGHVFDCASAEAEEPRLPSPPDFASRECAREIVESYWMALARDVSFDDYARAPIARDAAAELGVTTGELFRGSLPGDRRGPYVSQFLLLPPRFGAQSIDPRQKTFAPNLDHVTSYDAWLAVQTGFAPEAPTYDATERYIRNGRDLSAFVHVDVRYESYFNACLTLLDLRAPFNAADRRDSARTRDRLAGICGPHIRTLVAHVSRRALEAAWYEKWILHRRLRPEAFGGALHNVAERRASYPVHVDALASQAVARTRERFGTSLLPLAYPEGSPLHPSYPQGHASVAAACITILKAFFDGTTKLADLLAAAPAYEPASYERLRAPVVASADGLGLAPYEGPDANELTVAGELNKAASNIALGRAHAGVHWRSDYEASMMLGERVALSVLRDPHLGYDELFAGFTFERFFPVAGQTDVTV